MSFISRMRARTLNTSMRVTNPTSITGKLFFSVDAVFVVVFLTLRIEGKKLAGYWHFSLQREQKSWWRRWSEVAVVSLLARVLELWGNCDSLPLCTRTLASFLSKIFSLSPKFPSRIKNDYFWAQGFDGEKSSLKITDKVIAKLWKIQEN